MPVQYLRPPQCFLPRKRKRDITLEPVDGKDFAAWQKKQTSEIVKQAAETGFTAKAGQLLLVYGKNSHIEKIAVGVSNPLGLFDFAQVVGKLSGQLSEQTIKEASFSLAGIRGMEEACISWGLGCYRFDHYKMKNEPLPQLVLPSGADKTRIQSMLEALYMVRDLINMPANDLGPAELEKAARELANTFDATIKVVSDKSLARDFPLIFAVGDSSPRRPRLIEMQWGNLKHPKVTLVGKGVCFDTGGLDIKPSQYMALMKKDMGGAAHALGVARVVMGLKLPVRLKVIIPAVENAVSGTSFRPGDVFTSRKGLKVENTNTDAEGRLILADALTYASEDRPDVLIDFATLTGSARAALGADIPPFFSNSDRLAEELKKISIKAEDPLWPMPLWQPYKKLIESSIADLVNSAAVPGDLVYSAIFLQSFLVHDGDWLHLDVYAWENSGKPGRPKGGADTGMRAVCALLEKRYRKK